MRQPLTSKDLTLLAGIVAGIVVLMILLLGKSGVLEQIGWNAGQNLGIDTESILSQAFTLVKRAGILPF
jgi:hypothetical protein